MSDATKLPVEQQAAAMASISADGLPQAIERQAAAGARHSTHRRRAAQPAAVNRHPSTSDGQTMSSCSVHSVAGSGVKERKRL